MYWIRHLQLLKLFFMLFECVYIVDLLTCCSVFWNWYPSRHAGEQGTLIGDYVTGKHLKEISVCLWKCFLPSFCCEPWVEMSFSSHIKLRWRKLFLQQLCSYSAASHAISSRQSTFLKNAGYLEVLFLEVFQTCSGGGMKLGSEDLIIWVSQSCTYWQV